ncbi:MAG: c-type cytochrome [Acidobacteriota bacterium]
MRCIHCLCNFLIVSVVALVGCGAPSPQEPQAQEEITYNLGRPPSEEEIRAWDISVDLEGNGLPPGSGTAEKGAPIFSAKCSPCHGPTGEGPAHPASGFDGRLGSMDLVGGKGALRGYISASSLWENIKRAYPPPGGTLSADEAYAVTAYLLYRLGIIRESDVMDAKSLPKVEMPKPEERPKPLRYLAAPSP